MAGLRRSDDVPQPKHLMLLAERNGDRRLPIWIGPAEATAMAISLESVEHPRPMTYGLAASLLHAAGSQLREVRITRLTDSVFYATVVLGGPSGPQEVDARPSDAVNLALVALGGLLGLAGIRNPRRPVRCADCAGGQFAGQPVEVACEQVQAARAS